MTSPELDQAAPPAEAPSPRRPRVRRTRRGLMLAVLVGVVLVDQVSKQWAVNELTNRRIDVVWTLVLHRVENKGAAFSLFGGGGFGPLIALVAMGVVGVLLWQGRTVQTKLGAIALGLVGGGAIGNLIDRLARGHSGFLSGGVVDWIDFQWWPVFNVADMGVVIGGITLGLIYAFSPPADNSDDPAGSGGADRPGADASAGTPGDA